MVFWLFDDSILNIFRGKLLLTSAQSKADTPPMFAEIRKYKPVDNKTRKDRTADIEHALRPKAQANAGAQAFSVNDENGRFTTFTALDTQTEPPVTPPSDAGTDSVMLEEMTVVRLPGRA